MFKVSVVDALIFNDVLSIACKKIVDGEVAVGSKLSDGSRTYEVAGIPFVRYNSVQAMKENILLELRHYNIDKNELLGKVLTAI